MLKLNSYDEYDELENELSNLKWEVKDSLGEARENFVRMVKENSGKKQYYIGYAVYSSEGEFKKFDCGNFFIDREVKTLEDVFYLDYVVSNLVKSGEKEFIKIISFTELENNGTQKLGVK